MESAEHYAQRVVSTLTQLELHAAIRDAYAAGYAAGHKGGHADGYAVGFEAGRRATLEDWQADRDGGSA